LILLLGFTLPRDFAGGVGFVAALEEHRDKKREVRYEPARFLEVILKRGRGWGDRDERGWAEKEGGATKA
jgi:hypothetical protein